MRHVEPPVPPPSLSSPAALKERQAVADFYAAWDGKKKYDKFAAYKGPGVRDAMEVAFGGKCAYCESHYAATQPGAIEHYRPKGEVTIDGKRVPPGYYWLASEWTNLLPSCTDCNSARGQVLPDGTTKTVGKANAFPLVSEASRAHVPGSEKDEQRLLLHPYLDQPEDHLEFVWGTGTVDDGWIRPTTNDTGDHSAMGAATIEVCALQRRRLVASRRDQLLDLTAALESVVEAHGNIARHPDDPQFLTQFERHLAEVSRYLSDDAPYIAMARQVVAAYHQRLFGT